MYNKIWFNFPLRNRNIPCILIATHWISPQSYILIDTDIALGDINAFIYINLFSCLKLLYLTSACIIIIPECRISLIHFSIYLNTQRIYLFTWIRKQISEALLTQLFLFYKIHYSFSLLLEIFCLKAVQYYFEIFCFE